MPFGVNEGYTLGEIYYYLPSYIEFLIEYIDGFEISISEFEKLPVVTYFPKLPENASLSEKIKGSLRITHNGSIKNIKNCGKPLREYQYKLTERIHEILQMKASGDYVAPMWTPRKSIKTIPICELLDYIKKTRN